MEIWNVYVLPCLWAFLGCLGFCVIFNIHGVNIILASIGGSLGWLSYLLINYGTQNIALAAFVSGMVISGYAEMMARRRRCPASSYLLIAFFPLVPGAGLYYTMEHYFNREYAALLERARDTLDMAGGLALGVLLVASLTRIGLGRRGLKRGEN